MDGTRHREVLSGAWERRMTNQASESSAGWKMSVRAGVRVSPVCHKVWPFPPQPLRATVEHGDKQRGTSVGSSAVVCVAAAQRYTD